MAWPQKKGRFWPKFAWLPFMSRDRECPRVRKRRARWYRKAAEAGAALAQYRLGVLYLSEQGDIQSDPAEAVKWLLKAAAQQNAAAQNSLGVLYEQGKGVSRDRKEATKWYAASADQGYAKGEANLGRMYFDENGFPQDIVTGFKWFILASWQNEPLALTYMKQYGLGITGAQMAEAKKKAAEFKPRKRTQLRRKSKRNALGPTVRIALQSRAVFVCLTFPWLAAKPGRT